VEIKNDKHTFYALFFEPVIHQCLKSFLLALAHSMAYTFELILVMK